MRSPSRPNSSNYRRRRGTSLAAAALTFALVAPLAQPVAVAQDNTSTGHITFKPAASDSGVPAEAQGKNKMVPDAIYTKGGWLDYVGYHGYAYINKQGRTDDLADSNEPLVGNVIYLQYVTGRGEVSPTFYTITDSEGRFSFDLTRAVTDKVGAPPFQLAGTDAGRMRVRVWGENPDPEKYSVVMAGDAQSGRYTTRTYRTQESWNFTAGPSGSRITNGRFVLEEKPNHAGWLAKPEDQWTRALDDETGKPTVDGQFPDYGAFGTIKSLAAPNQSMVWWENGEDAGSLPGYYKYQPGQGDRAAGGVEIVGSYLNDEVARQIDAWKEANKGYTVEQERTNQERIITEYQKEHGEGSHIAETVVVPSKDDGTIYLPFKGTYGYSRTQENFNPQIPNQLEEGDFGKVAETFETETGASRYGAFTGLAIGKRRHINMDYMYIYPRIEGRDVKNAAFPMNMFQNYGDQGTVLAGANMNGLQFPLMSATPMLDIPEYNSYDNKGRAGSKVTTKTAGLMPNADYAIRWYATDPSGNQVELKDKMCEFKSDDKGMLSSCDFQAPEDLNETTVYTAAVVSVDPASREPSSRWEIADSFTAVVPVKLALGSRYDEYVAEDVAPLFKEAPDNQVEGTAPKYSADKLPEGLEIDPETGKITGTPTKAGTSEVIVTREVEVMVDKYVGVTDENGDPVYENPDEEDLARRIQKTERTTVPEKWLERVSAEITVTDTALKDGVVGEPYEQDVKPEGFGPLPQGFEIEEGSLNVEGLPEGLAFENGKISGTPTAPVVASEEQPNVTFTYTLVDQNGKKHEQTDIVPLAVKSQADFYEPQGQDQTVESGAQPKPEDSVANKEDLPDGTTYEWKDVPNTDDPGDKQCKVVVTYPDGSKDNVDVTVEVQPKDPAVVPGENTTVPADKTPHEVGKVENPKGDESGKLVDKDGKEIDGSKVEIDRDGNVKVTVPEGTDPQDAKVIVTDKGGKTVGEIGVKIVDARSDAAKFVPNYSDRKSVESGKTEQSKNPFEGMTDVPVKEATGTPSEGSEDWTFETSQTDGVVTATSPTYEKVGEKIAEKMPELKETPREQRWDKFVKDFTPFAKPDVTVDFVYNDGSQNYATASFDLVGKDGKSLLDPDGDFDGDGKTNREEIEKGSNPADEKSTPDETAPTIDKVTEGDKTIKGSDDRPNSNVTVEFPDGTKKTVPTDGNGNWKVDVPSGVELKPNDKITVTDEAGNQSETQVQPKPKDGDSNYPKDPAADQSEQATSKYVLVYPVSYVRAGEKGTSIRPNVTVKEDGFDFTRQPMPKGAKFSTDYKGASFDEHGALTITAPKGVDEVVVPVTVTFADGSTATTNAKFIVRANEAAQNYAPAYELGVNASPGETVLVHQTGEESLPAGTEFELIREASDLNGWVVRVDAETGVIEATAPQGNDAKRAQLAVKMSYFDGSEQIIKATVDPGSTPSMAAKLKPTKTTLEVGVGEVDEGNVFANAPKGTKFTLADQVSGNGWSVAIDETTGTLTVKTDETVKPNATRTIPVQVTLPDGSRKVVDVKVKAVKPGAEKPTPTPKPAPKGSSLSSANGSSAGSVIGIVVGLLALIGGVGWALKMNEPQIRKVLRDMGIHI